MFVRSVGNDFEPKTINFGSKKNKAMERKIKRKIKIDAFKGK